MKSIIKFSGMVLVAAVLFSCNNSMTNDLIKEEASSALDEATIFSSSDLARGAVNGILVPMAETNSYRGRLLPWYGMNTDTEWYNSSEVTSSDSADLAVYDAKPNNSQMNTSNNAWAMMYTGIERANLCIRGIRKYGNPTAGSDMGYLLGTALTLRAVYYADLIKAWGDVPLRLVPVSTVDIYLPKTSRDIIYKQLIADLGEAENLVPWPGASTNTTTSENINKAFVKGLRARLALAASGYQQYPDGVRRSNDAALSVQNMYALALAECRDVINSGTAHLESSFETLWRKYNQEDLSVGGEPLWQIPFASGRGRMLFTFAVKHTSSDQFQQMGSNKGGVAGPLPFVFYDYDVKDLRRNVTCVPYLYGTATAGVAKQVLGSLDKWYFGKYRFEWMNRIVTSTNDDGVDKMYMRYAEILLMAAETANQMEGPTSAAVYLRQLRSRAFATADQATKVNAYISTLTSQTAMFNAIVDEHKYEFTGEMERKQALIRWNLLSTNMSAAKDKMTRLQSRTGEYADVASTLYYKYDTDGVSLIVYGLNHGETSNPGAGYTSFAWTNLASTKIAALYRRDPNTRQFWPIWQVFLDSSNGQLTNDYGY